MVAARPSASGRDGEFPHFIFSAQPHKMYLEGCVSSIYWWSSSMMVNNKSVTVGEICAPVMLSLLCLPKALNAFVILLTGLFWRVIRDVAGISQASVSEWVSQSLKACLPHFWQFIMFPVKDSGNRLGKRFLFQFGLIPFCLLAQDTAHMYQRWHWPRFRQ